MSMQKEAKVSSETLAMAQAFLLSDRCIEVMRLFQALDHIRLEGLT